MVPYLTALTLPVSPCNLARRVLPDEAETFLGVDAATVFSVRVTAVACPRRCPVCGARLWWHLRSWCACRRGTHPQRSPSGAPASSGTVLNLPDSRQQAMHKTTSGSAGAVSPHARNT